MSNLGPQQQNQTFDGLLQVPGGVTLQLQTVQDGTGENTALKVGYTNVQVGNVVDTSILQIPGGVTASLQTVLDGNGNPTGLQLSSSGANVTTSDTFVASENGTQITGAVPRLISDGFGDYVNVKDYGAVGNGVTNDQAAFNVAAANASSISTALVPVGTYVANPVYSAGKNLLWNYIFGGNSKNVLTTSGTRGGWFSNYDCTASQILLAQINENQSSISGGGYRDAIFVEALDSDTVNYTTIGQKVTHAIRAYVNGAYSSGAYQPQYKDLVAANFVALGNIQWNARGVSALAVDAVQYGLGVASNEFSVFNPSAAGGGQAQSKSMAAVQAIVKSQYAADDSTHISRGVYIENQGERITSGLQLISNTSGGFSSTFRYGIKMSDATIATVGSAIVMPKSETGNVGTIIEYDSNDYSQYDRTNNIFQWVIGGNIPFSVTTNGVSVGSSISSSTRIYVEPGTSSVSQMRLLAGVAPSSPVNGDLWFDGTNLKMQIGGVTKTFTLV